MVLILQRDAAALLCVDLNVAAYCTGFGGGG